MVNFPLQVDIDVTNECNFNCEYCTAKFRKNIKDELSANEIEKIVDELYEMGVLSFNFAGGEPLLKKGIYKILKHAIALPCTDITMVSNGSLIDNKLNDILEYPNFHLVVSLDNISSSVNEKYRKDTQKVVRNIENLLRDNKRFVVSQVVTNKNINDYIANLDKLEEMGINNVLLIKYISQMADDIDDIPYQRWKEFLCMLTRLKKEGRYKGLMLSIACPWEIYLPLMEDGLNLDEIYKIWNYKSPLLFDIYRESNEMGCHAGITSCNILANGDVYPCSISKMDKHLLCGNVRNQSFKNIWEKSEVLNKLRNIKIDDIRGGCYTCKIKDLCGGGCRIRAYNKYGSLFAEDCCPSKGGK
ncbi:radical SAM additional 4Fe4S-binding SPASM domain-containing protein [Pseudobutyrivibrio sp. UC1225]|uniref:radical SAM/SPASM domain-containing protein n=1 Tax=Pseudobutyrivibrio sp. UC1225 TaxID=1798185 RepID=UPI0008F11A88|nr:radical SAM protein [Pseudobutyrivibrio sp. UC1225]SFO34188.1 radical SAM additional 4Fe4S-binding SPASM domain-containing protein [Pseudobutyrivibrio sp. UC1225]